LIDISGRCGLQIALNEENKLVFHDEIEHMPVSTRRSSDMKGLWLYPECDYDVEIYYMYRDVHLKSDKDLFEKYKIRYDMTVIPPFVLGKEFVKTAGHYHPNCENTKVGYPEVYEVIYGVAHYILQKRDESNYDVSDCVMIEAKEGDKVIIPSGYGHVTVNPSKKPLVMSNLVCRDFNSEYALYKELKGAAYYEVSDYDGSCRLVQNNNYGLDVPLRKLDLKYVHEFGIHEDKSLYQSFKDLPERFDWLLNPQRYIDEMELLTQKDDICSCKYKNCFGQKGSSSERNSLCYNNRTFWSGQD